MAARGKASSGASRVTSDEFLKALVATGLLAEDDARAVEVELAARPALDAHDLAGRLVKAGKLTQFQAQQAVAGKAKALVLGDYLIVDRIGAGGMGQVF